MNQQLLSEIGHWLLRLAGDTAVLLAVFGLLGKRWLDGRLQKHDRDMAGLKADLEASMRVLQAEIDKTIVVTKVHFETEFEAYKIVFAKLAEMRIQFGGLRPSLDIVPAGDTRDARRGRLAQLAQKAQDAYNQLITTSENLSPFYPTEIYRQIQECQRLASLEINDILTSSHDEFTHEWFARGRDNLRQFMTAYHNVSDLIRDRISKLALIPRV
jgi:hypothetical protein